MGSNPQPQEVGPVYDLLLSTRDGSKLTVLNGDRMPVQLSSVAYMCSIDRNQSQHEETELQHKDQLVQLASANLIDREFDQWPQVTQGDWSSGTLQRVFTGPNADQSRYWDGEGLLWPIFDYVPQKPFLGPQRTTGLSLTAGTVMGCVGGWVYMSGINAEPGYGISVRDSGGTQLLIWFYGDSSASVLDPFGVGIVCDAMAVGGGALWAVARPNTTTVTIYRLNGTNATTLAVDTSLATGLTINTNLFAASLDARQVGNRFYVAAGITYFHTTLGMKSALVIQDWTSPGAPAAGVAIDLPNAHSSQLGGSIITDVKIAGDTIYVALSDGSTSNKGWNGGQVMAGAGSRTYILAYSLVAGTWATAAVIEDASGVHFVQAAGVMFVLAYTSESANTTLSIDMYLLQGSSLQHIGPVSFPTPNWVSCSKVTSWGPYAFFALQRVDSFASTYNIFAYDVLRGRFFRVHSRDTVPGTGNPIGHNLATFGSQKRTNASYPNGVFAQFGMAYDTTNLVAGSFSQELYFGVTPTTSFGGVSVIPPPIQQGVSITSSIIDFTSAQPKLYRQLQAKFSPLFNDASASVTLNAWLDQDPANLSATPDFTATINGSASPGAVDLSLSINQVATKLVYQLVTNGGGFSGSNTPAPAPKPVSVIVKAATGWVQTLQLDLAPRLGSNSKSVQDIWTYQGIDSTAAYNFLRQLWRLQGGQVAATFPNGDSGPWLIQDMHFDSPKPYGVSFRADQQNGLKYLCTLKLREDID